MSNEMPPVGHHYRVRTLWTGAEAGPVRDYTSYSRDHVIEIAGKAPIRCSSDPAFRGDPGRHNPEDLLVAALSACHMLWYLHLCATAGVEVLAYEDRAEGVMITDRSGGGRFSEVTLRPHVTITAASDAGLAASLHGGAHDACFIANSVNFPVRHEAVIRAGAGAATGAGDAGG